MRLLIALLLLSGTTNFRPAGEMPPRAAAEAEVAYRLPLAGPLVVTRDFAPPTSRFGPGHRGVDMAGAAGSAVLASADGTVSYAGELAGRIVVAVTHNDGIRTTYEPLASLSVHLHGLVNAGERLGTLASGHPGCTAPAPLVCLHWGALRSAGRGWGAGGSPYIDPLLLLDRKPVTLLPPVGAG